VGAFLAGPSCRVPLLAVPGLPALEPSVVVVREASVQAGPHEGFGPVPLLELDSFSSFPNSFEIAAIFQNL
jgi:hypothetical protein